ncbi:alpha/beta fold hydrolase [Candidatus Woesearchaeota archaeon]|nr:alpha/beta fold hydrolase [Candidatus Woesearchaeota archaeon]
MAHYVRMSGQLISFEALDKLQLEGLLCRTETKTKTCVVHVHGMTDNFVGLSIVDSIMQASHANNFAFFTFNNRGMGTITTFPRLKEHLIYRTIGTSFENFKDSTLDIHAALKVLKKLGYKKFILSGHSTGCQKITYYQLRKQSKAVKGLILLAPADDLNYQKKSIGRKKFKDTLEIARQLVRKGKGKEIMPTEAEPSYFSAKRYYELYRTGSIEGNLFNYETNLKHLTKIKVPVLVLFGAYEEYAAMPPRKMLKKLGDKFSHPYSRTVFVKDADHCFCRYEEKVQQNTDKWFKNMII